MKINAQSDDDVFDQVQQQRDVLARMLSGAVLNDMAVMEYVGEWVGVEDAIIKLRLQGQKVNRGRIDALRRRSDEILKRAHRDLFS